MSMIPVCRTFYVLSSIFQFFHQHFSSFFQFFSTFFSSFFKSFFSVFLNHFFKNFLSSFFSIFWYILWLCHISMEKLNVLLGIKEEYFFQFFFNFFFWIELHLCRPGFVILPDAAEIPVALVLHQTRAWPAENCRNSRHNCATSDAKTMSVSRTTTYIRKRETKGPPINKKVTHRRGRSTRRSTVSV